MNKLIAEGILPSPDLGEIDDVEGFIKFLKERGEVVATKTLYLQFKEKKKKMDFGESLVRVKKMYEPKNKKFEVEDWVRYYLSRYEKIKKILLQRESMRDFVSIDSLSRVNGRKQATLIAMVYDILQTKKGNWLLTLEDPTGQIKGIVRSDKPAAKMIDEIVPDQVIGVKGVRSGIFFFIDEIILPDIVERERPKIKDDIYAVFMSDIHIGSKMFLPKEFDRFIKWINGELGNQSQVEMAKKVKYIFISGDLVDGVGIYPEQESELNIKDIYKQYEKFTELISKIPEHIPIIIIPGNHDAIRIAEPQPKLDDDIVQGLYDLPNVIPVSNPSLVNIHGIENEGVDVLMYHGYSFDYLISNVKSLEKFGYERADLIMRFLLRSRHLAPMHGSTMIAPLPEDFLVIDYVPHILATAHIHKAKIGEYKGTLTLTSSCFQGKTTFQEKVGHNPEPARIPIVNLRDWKARLIKFG